MKIFQDSIFFYFLPKKQEINKSIYLKDSNEWPIVINTNQLMMTIIIKIQGWFSLKKDLAIKSVLIILLIIPT